MHAHSTSSAPANLQTSISESLGISSATSATVSASLPTTISVFLTAFSAFSAINTASSQSPTMSSSFAISSSPSVSKFSSTNSSALGTGAIAAIVMGIVVCAGLAAAIVIYRLRKPKLMTAEVRAPPVPANFVAEKDGSPSGPNDWSGDGQLIEMASNDRLRTKRAELDGREMK